MCLTWITIGNFGTMPAAAASGSHTRRQDIIEDRLRSAADDQNAPKIEV